MKKKRKIKFELIFCCISLLFLLLIFLFYGFKIYVNSKKYTENIISNVIIKNKTITKENNTYLFKGSNSNNYIEFSNMMFRIIKVNIDGSVDIILDSSINTLGYNTNSDYLNSDINNYLNDVFLDELDKYYLSKTIVCNDKVDSINNYKCENKSANNYVKLLDLSDYINSKKEDSYIESSENIWLSTVKDDKNIWVVSNNKIAYLDNTSSAFIRPVITLKNSCVITSGNGTKENPYKITKKDSVGVGSYIKINDDLWRVYSKNNKKLKLVLVNNINNGITKYRYSTKNTTFDPKEENTLAYYLNHTYYDSLSYKKLLVDFEVSVGSYDKSYSDINSKKVKVKVGIPSVNDFKYSGNSFSYYLLNGNGEEVYYFEDGLYTSQPNLIRPIRPTIAIKQQSLKKGKGTFDDPYIIEVK